MSEQHDRNEPLESASAQSTLRPLNVIWKHKGLVSLGVVIGAVLGTLYNAQTKPVYASGAQVLVVKKRSDALPMGGANGQMLYDDYLATHQVLIRSPLIVGDAIREGKLQDLPSFVGQGDPTGRIIDGLRVTREVKDTQQTNILNISYRGPVSADCRLVLNAVIEAYRKSLNGDYQNVSDETARLISQAKEILEIKLAGTKAKYSQFRLDHPFLWKSKDGVSMVQDRLQQIEGKRSALQLRQSEIEGRIALIKNAIFLKRSQEDLLAMVTESAGRLTDGKNPVENPLEVLTLKLSFLLEYYGKDHPEVQTLRKQIAYYRDRKDPSSWNNLENDIPAGPVGKALEKGTKEQGPKGVDDARPPNPIEAHLNRLQREVDDARWGAEELRKLLATEQEEAKKLIIFENQDETFRNEIASHEQLFKSVQKRLDEVNILQNFGGFVFQIISPTGNGGRMGGNTFPVYAVACLLGFVAGFGMAYLAEVSDQSFRTPDEIRRQLGLPIIGHIPFFEKKEEVLQKSGAEGSFLSPILCTQYRSKSREAEAYRVVRTSVYFSNRGQGHKIIQVTSPNVGDGKSTLAANLAVSIAQSGKSVLLIDADFRRPRVHKVFGLKPTSGLASVIMEQAELNDVIQSCGVPGLSVLPCGPIPNNPAELLTQPRLKELLEIMREKFDFVIVDTPPVLAVTDPSVVAPLVDGVIMTVRISKNGRPHAKRAKEILATLGANVLGVVVNGVGRDAEGYGYDKYHYGYTYRSYEYSYASYYDDNAYIKQNGNDSAKPDSGTDEDHDKDKKKGGRLLSWLFKR
jgi:capsular exopolysaccharide synthesis family protein